MMKNNITREEVIALHIIFGNISMQLGRTVLWEDSTPNVKYDGTIEFRVNRLELDGFFIVLNLMGITPYKTSKLIESGPYKYYWVCFNTNITRDEYSNIVEWISAMRRGV